jgi:hypothetical protein
MTRRHFEALADALAEVRPDDPHMCVALSIEQWEKDMEAVADVCEEANDNFDRERFINACKTR